MQYLLISLFVSIYLMLSGCNSGAVKSEQSNATFVITRPWVTDTVINKKYVCQIRAIQHIELRAMEKGYLQQIYVDEGQYIKKGQLMFKIMPSIYQAEKNRSQAELDYTEIEYANIKLLADSHIVSKNELALSKAKLDRSKAELDLTKIRLQFTEIKAPFDGIMDRFNVRLGSLVDEGELLSTLSDNSSMWVYFNVPEVEYLNYMDKTKGKGETRVSLQLANQNLFNQQGNIETIEADFNNETGNIAFRSLFPNPDRILRHGETGNIIMPVKITGAVIIPQKATFEILDKRYVYVLNKDNQLVAREIKISQELPHLFVVEEGVGSGDNILSEGLNLVSQNQKIKPVYKSCQSILESLNSVHAE